MIPPRNEILAMLRPYVRDGRDHELTRVADDLLFLFDLPHDFPGEQKAEIAKLEREAKRIERAAEGIATVKQWKLDRNTRQRSAALNSLARQLRDEAAAMADRLPDDTKETDWNAHELAGWTLDAIERLSGKRASRRDPAAQTLCKEAFTKFGVTTDSDRNVENYLRDAITRRLKGQHLTKAKLAG